jgi:NTE family protein
MSKLATCWHAAVLLAAVVSPLAANAVEEGPGSEVIRTDRPRVGLVLGGGGARGAAHIGVLRELERMRVPIDAIAGTSMGAVVGGLYASGYSPAELEQVVASTDWAAGLTDEPERSDLRLRRKQDEQHYPMNPDLGLHQGELQLPLGLVQGQKLDLILRELTVDVSHVHDFDQLPIPFRAIAANIETGERHVLGQGDLATAIRASMSVPGVLAPARVDDDLLVDGGLVGNLPIDVMREMDVDIVIAVNVEFPLYAIEDLESALAISEQMLTILIRKETVRQIESLGESDVLIEPQLGNYGSANFADILTTIEPGADAARDAESHLQSLALDESAYAAWSERHKTPPRVDGELAFVRVEQNSNLATDVIESGLRVAAGDPIDVKQLSAEAARLHGLNVFEKVNYRLVEEHGETGVVFDARAKSWGPNFLRFGLSLENDFEGATTFDLRARLIRPAVNRYGGEWTADLRLGTEPQFFSEFYQPLRVDQRFFVAPYIDLNQSNVNLFVDHESIARIRIAEFTGGIDLGVEIGNIGEFRLGAFRGRGAADVIVGDPSIPSPDFDTGGLQARMRFDTLDTPWFPTSGLRTDIKWRQLRPEFGADESYDTIEVDFEAFASRGKSTFGFGIDFATTLSFDGELQDLFRLGGFRRLSGFERGAISGPHAAVAKLLFHRRVGTSAGGLFEVPMYLGASLEAGNVWQTRSDMSLGSALIHGSLYFGMDTYVGPVIFGAGLGQDGYSNFYLFVGAPPARTRL